MGEMLLITHHFCDISPISWRGKEALLADAFPSILIS